MKHYIGIDLGTTNSAICSYDGTNIRIWKSPEQNDITPSAIFIDKRKNRYYGSKAYNQAPYNPNNSATLFKRFMGTDTKMRFESADLCLTPEECSAEILKVLYGYLPEEIRNDPDTATVITVPAAFNQMKKDATLQAAKLAGIGKVALMQEPVAAIMSIMRTSNQDGIFLVYDLGGGTFDVSVAENINGRVNLLAHGGIEMCGGRDIDRLIFIQLIVPWLKENFNLPEDFISSKKYQTFCRVAHWAAETAKIELSAAETATVALSEGEARSVDEDGKELYIDIDITRDQINALMSDIAIETIAAAKETIYKAGLSPRDLTRIVFVGGPTNYKPLRDAVAFELSLPADIDVNPMTAVAEGASIFAESIDWSSEAHNRKVSNKTVDTGVDLSFKFTARTTNDTAKIMTVLKKDLSGHTVEFISLDTGWSSGRTPLENNLQISLPLSSNGENRFSVKVFDEFGHQKEIKNSDIVITKTLATIGAIPASHSIGVEVIDKLGGVPTLEFLVNEGDSLPKKGSITFKAGQTLNSGTDDSINIKIWEGDIQSPITDNRFVGILKISGRNIGSASIPIGADIECEYEMSDSGTINFEASVPCIGASFGNRNFYSRQDGQPDLTNVDSLAEDGRSVIDRIDCISDRVDDPLLEQARKKAELAASIDSQALQEPEDVQKASNELLNAKKLLNRVKQSHLKETRQLELNSFIKEFEEIKEYASTAEISAIENSIKSAQKAIDLNDTNFENITKNINSKIFDVMFKLDWFAINMYHQYVSSPTSYIDQTKFEKLKRLGDQALASGDINTLRKILFELASISTDNSFDDRMFDIANIVKG